MENDTLVETQAETDPDDSTADDDLLAAKKVDTIADGLSNT